MIKDPQRIQTFYLTVSSLLPVDPPEVHTFFFTGVMKIFEVRFHKLRISRITAHGILCLIIHAHGFCHLHIHFLMSPHTISRMHIQCRAHASVMETLQKALRIREKFLIPGVTGPATAIFLVNIHQMPVHINDSYSKRNIFFIEPVHQSHIAFFCILIITAPPVAQSKSRKHWCFSHQVIQIL